MRFYTHRLEVTLPSPSGHFSGLYGSGAESWEADREPGAERGSWAAEAGRACGAESGTPRPARAQRARPAAALPPPGVPPCPAPCRPLGLSWSLCCASRAGRISRGKINREKCILREMSLWRARSPETAAGGRGKRSLEVIGSLAWSAHNFLRIYETLYQDASPVIFLHLSHMQTSLFVPSPRFPAARARCNAPTHGQGYIPAVPRVRRSLPIPALASLPPPVRGSFLCCRERFHR